MDQPISAISRVVWKNDSYEVWLVIILIEPRLIFFVSFQVRCDNHKLREETKGLWSAKNEENREKESFIHKLTLHEGRVVSNLVKRGVLSSAKK